MTPKDIEKLIHEIIDAAEDYDSETGGFISEVALMEKLRACLPVVYGAGVRDGLDSARKLSTKGFQ